MKTIKTLSILVIAAGLCAFTIKGTKEDKALQPPMANNDKEIMDAALVSPHNGNAYFFKGNLCHQYDIRKDELKGIRKLRSDAFKGVPTNVDAALVHPKNKKAYIFKGNSYYRFDMAKGKLEKEGIIGQDGWKGLDGPIDAVVARPNSGYSYFFKGDKVHRWNHSKHKIDQVNRIGDNQVWRGVPSNPDLALAHINDKVYFFKDDYYYRYSWSTQQVDKTGLIGTDGWKGLFNRIDACNGAKLVTRDRTYYFEGKGKDKVLFFKLPSKIPFGYLSKARDVEKRRLGYDSYKGIPSPVDAVLLHPKNKLLYFFKGKKYYRYDEKQQKVTRTGTIGVNGWKGIPNHVDAALINPRNGKGYFFKGDKYYRFDFDRDERDKVGVIGKSGWKGVPKNLDAAFSDTEKTYFYKKSTEYVYEASRKRVTATNKIPSTFFK